MIKGITKKRVHIKHNFKNWKTEFNYIKTNLGLTNENFILNNQFLLRKSIPETNLFTQRKNEVVILPLLEGKQINLPVLDYFFDENNNFIYVTPYIKNAKTFFEIEKTEEKFLKISKLIKKLHQINWKNSQLKQMNMKDNLLLHIKKSKYNYNNQKINTLINKLIDFLDNFNWNEKMVVSHNDTLMENFLIDENDNFYLIDYEYCSLNTHYYDVAIVIAASNLTHQSKLLSFWLKQFKMNLPEEKIKVMYFVLYRDVLAYFWGKAMLLNKKKEKYHKLVNEKEKESFVVFKEILKITKKRL